MAINVSTDSELWRAEALNCYRAYLTRQPLGTNVFEQMNGDAIMARLQREDERLMWLLRETGDGECMASAGRYPGREA